MTRASLLALGLALSIGCAGGGTTPSLTSPTTASGFLTGTWTGSLIITPEMHDATVPTPRVIPTTWVFRQAPNSIYSVSVTFADAWLSAVEDPLLGELIPADQPGAHFVTVGGMTACAAGAFTASGTAQATTITATVDGMTCAAPIGTGGFTGSVTLTKGR